MTKQKPYQILTDSDVSKVLTMKVAIQKIEDALREKSQGTLIAPPRFSIDINNGSLVFTAGAATKKEKVIGFRVYPSFEREILGTNYTQLVAVFDSDSGDFKGVIIGSLVGAIRTGAIGGVAVKYMSNPDSEALGILGSGFQAKTQLEAANAIRNLNLVKIFSPNKTHSDRFAEEMGQKLKLNIQPVKSAREAVENVDILLCATDSETPILQVDWLKPGIHINTIGPSELDLATIVKTNTIATDSITQLKSHPKPEFIFKKGYGDQIIDLSDFIIRKRKPRQSPNDITLFLSAGLAGTEVIIANEVMRLQENL